ncbi:hypothetical protein BJ508DRAFT_114326 [Ascobolus immersus RN42]|uniref:F-box domain-containing protein n=1 Tax=Ascobolus immersus RN42 TaxID=1160509 RepID=A0A3N4I5M8_ASCIM|nr:hypothetical protein BJ508DRAFT_114326 [Ascobolus immersus RN42]
MKASTSICHAPVRRIDVHAVQNRQPGNLTVHQSPPFSNTFGHNFKYNPARMHLPPELRLQIYDLCTAYTLLNLSQTSPLLRHEILNSPTIFLYSYGYIARPLNPGPMPRVPTLTIRNIMFIDGHFELLRRTGRISPWSREDVCSAIRADKIPPAIRVRTRRDYQFVIALRWVKCSGCGRDVFYVRGYIRRLHVCERCCNRFGRRSGVKPSLKVRMWEWGVNPAKRV